jgi:hypothetical protein
VSNYICEAEDSIRRRLVRKYKTRVGSDKVLDFVYEMRPNIIEKEYIIEEIEHVRNYLGIKRRVTNRAHAKWTRTVLEDLMFGPTDISGLTIKDERMYGLARFLMRNNIISERAFGILPTGLGRIPGAVRRGIVSVSSLKDNDPIIKFLKEEGGWLSFVALQEWMDLPVRLRKSHEDEEESIEKLVAKRRSGS